MSATGGATILLSENGARGNTFMKLVRGHARAGKTTLSCDGVNTWKLVGVGSRHVDYQNASYSRFASGNVVPRLGIDSGEVLAGLIVDLAAINA